MNKLSYFLMLIFTLLVYSSLFAQWTPQNSGIPSGDIITLAAVNENVCWGVTRAPGSYVTRTMDGGTTWFATNLSSLNDFFSIAALSADTAWISANGFIYNTTNGGLNWIEQLTTNNRLMLIVRFFDSNNGVCMSDGSGGHPEIYTTTNGGNIWTPVASSNIPDFINNEGFIPDNAWVVGNTIWVPTNGNFTFPGSLYKSTDRGLTWNVTRPINDQAGSFCAFKDSLNGLLSSSFNNLVKRTTDGGATWTTTGVSVPDWVTPFLITYVPGSSGAYMITSFTYSTQIPGSAYTLDDGATWITVDSVAHGRAAFVSPSTGWSWGGANVIYKWTGIPLPVENTNEVVQNFHLEQNYPNPFNPSTTIQFRIPNSSFVNLKVYDILGREVATLLSEEKPAGIYQVSFDASSLSSGIYFYKLQAGSLVETKKMILLK